MDTCYSVPEPGPSPGSGTTTEVLSWGLGDGAVEVRGG